MSSLVPLLQSCSFRHAVRSRVMGTDLQAAVISAAEAASVVETDCLSEGGDEVFVAATARVAREAPNLPSDAIGKRQNEKMQRLDAQAKANSCGGPFPAAAASSWALALFESLLLLNDAKASPLRKKPFTGKEWQDSSEGARDSRTRKMKQGTTIWLPPILGLTLQGSCEEGDRVETIGGEDRERLLWLSKIEHL